MPPQVTTQTMVEEEKPAYLRATGTHTTTKVSCGVKQLKDNGRRYTLAEVGAHSTKDDCWIVIEGMVFDVTALLPNHPGGHLPIVSVAGRDVTQLFYSFHPKRVGDYHLHKYYKGQLQDTKEFPITKDKIESDFAELQHTLVANGLFEHSPAFFIKQCVRNTLILVMAWCCVLYGPSVAGPEWAYSVQVLLGGFLLGLYWQQSAFMGHDLGHSAVTYDSKWDYYIGLVLGNFCTGISVGWWKDNHYTHHVVTNSVTHDPDIQHPPIMAVSELLYDRRHKGGKPIVSHYYGPSVDMDFTQGAAKKLVGYQAYLFYPIMAVARFNLYVQSYMFILGSYIGGKFADRKPANRGAELVAMTGFVAWVSLMFSYISWEDGRLTFILLSHAVAGLLHVQIVLSHFSLAAYEGVMYGDPATGKVASKLESWPAIQLAGTLNVDCPTWMDWFHGGLQFQSEHHLFPKIPRHNLRAASKYIRAFAKDNDLPYISLSFWDANVRTFEHLRKHGCKISEVLDEAVSG